MCPVAWLSKRDGWAGAPLEILGGFKIDQKTKPRCRSLQSKVFKIDTPQEVHVANFDARFRQERTIPILASDEKKHWFELCIFDVRHVSCFPVVLRRDFFF